MNTFIFTQILDYLSRELYCYIMCLLFFTKVELFLGQK